MYFCPTQHFLENYESSYNETDEQPIFEHIIDFVPACNQIIFKLRILKGKRKTMIWLD